MAYCGDWQCSKCGEEVFSDIPRDRICYKCKEIIEEEERVEHFRVLDTLSIDERLRRVEEWIHEHTHEGLVEDIGFDY